MNKFAWFCATESSINLSQFLQCTFFREFFNCFRFSFQFNFYQLFSERNSGMNLKLDWKFQFETFKFWLKSLFSWLVLLSFFVCVRIVLGTRIGNISLAFWQFWQILYSIYVTQYHFFCDSLIFLQFSKRKKKRILVHLV